MNSRTAVRAAQAIGQPAPQHITRQGVSSSNLSSVGYDAARHILEIHFKGGGTYQYYNVPQSVYSGLMGASSKGKYFHSNIKNSYRWKKTA